MPDGTYNGWANYPTWAVNMWLTNDEGLYDFAMSSIVDAGHGRAAAALKDMVTELRYETDAMPDEPSMFADLLGWAIDLVDWFEIADSFIEEEVEE